MILRSGLVTLVLLSQTFTMAMAGISSGDRDPRGNAAAPKGEDTAQSGSGVGVIGDEGEGRSDRTVRDRQVYTRPDGTLVRIRTVTKLLKNGGISEKEKFRIVSDLGVRTGKSRILRDPQGRIVSMERSKKWTYANGQKMEYSYRFTAERSGSDGEYILEYNGQTFTLSHMYFIRRVVGEEFLD